MPRLRGLGHSEKATYHGLADVEDAEAYLAHPILGARLRECTAALLAHREKSARAILGSPDDLKFRSCLTLFRAVTGPDDSLWQEALDQFFAGEPDPATLLLLGRSQ